MTSTAAAIGVIACAALLTGGLASAGSAAALSRRLAGAADAAALAAADAASGAIPGIPCDLAVDVAASAGAAVTACELDGLVATIRVAAPFGALTATAAARAGPPPAAPGAGTPPGR